MTNQRNTKKHKKPETAREYLDRGVKRFNAGDLEGAVEDYTRAIGMDPRLADARMKRGIVFHQMGKYAPAIEDFTRALEWTGKDTRLMNYQITFKNVKILIHRAAAYNAKEEYRKAIADAERAIEILESNSRCYYQEPDYRPALLQLAYAWMKEGDKEGDNIRRKLHYYDEAIHNYESYASAVKEDATARFHLGFLYFQKKEYGQAERNYAIAVSLDEKFANAWFGLGLVSIARAKWGSAVGYFNKVISLQEEHPNAFAGRGHAYFQIKKYDLAREDCEKAIDLNREGDWVQSIKPPRSVLADIQEIKDKIMENLANYRKVAGPDADVQTAPDGDGPWTAESELDEIIADCTKAISETPLDVVNYFKRGDAYVGKGDPDKAIESYNEGIDLEEDNPVLWKKRGFVLLLKGEEERAEEDCLKALSLNPKDAQVRDIMDEIQKKKDEAVGGA